MKIKNFIFLLLAVAFLGASAFYYNRRAADTQAAAKIVRERSIGGSRSAGDAEKAQRIESDTMLTTVFNYAGGVTAIIQMLIWAGGLIRRR